MSGVLVNADEMAKRVRRDFPVKFRCDSGELYRRLSHIAVQSGKAIHYYPNVAGFGQNGIRHHDFPLYTYDRNARFCMWKGSFWFKNASDAILFKMKVM